ncbi:hypothetical protein NW754_004046 [Fusarium falciforme]|nr:hypothetical protein NW754_004046 [Fusarium falciforme]KAJ4175686.1 hypothetical protein NW767_015700 [Fusarium falciforme]KAJ4245098.1 hypothetical protein NW757_010108 [Fusarium falciforme]
MSTAIVSALGAVLGYLGAEVAEESIFERILWPQRFFNYINFEPTAAGPMVVASGSRDPEDMCCNIQ